MNTFLCFDTKSWPWGPWIRSYSTEWNRSKSLWSTVRFGCWKFTSESIEWVELGKLWCLLWEEAAKNWIFQSDRSSGRSIKPRPRLSDTMRNWHTDYVINQLPNAGPILIRASIKNPSHPLSYITLYNISNIQAILSTIDRAIPS